MNALKAVDGGVTAPRGFLAAGVAAGIKPDSTKRDCALIVSEAPAAVAGVFTTNVMKAPPVAWNQEVCRHGKARVVLINSGNANACTGKRGEQDARAMAELVAHATETPLGEVCICSTGVIGVPLPMANVERGVKACAASLSIEGSRYAAEAIMTTDTVPKERAVEVPLVSGTVRIGAIAKGSGMIAPNMATMIAVITTDATLEPGPLDDALRRAVGVSFNRICVDNDMSTSDTVLCFANGRSGLAPLQPGSPDLDTFERALTGLCQDLAQALVRDGEGATKFVEIEVSGTASDEEAGCIARAIGQSQLCKTAFFGGDPNWGRFACAAGYAGVAFDPDRLAIWLDDLLVAHGGRAAEYEEHDAVAVMTRPEFRVRVEVGDGPGNAVFWTSDLSHDYVSINADYRS